MSTKIWSAIGVGVLGMIGAAASCTSESSGGTSSTEGTGASSTTSSSGSGTGGATATGTGSGGQGGGQGGQGAGQGGQGQTGSGGTGGSTGYQSCSECVDDMTGAPANECNAAHDACFAIKECVGIYNCVFNGSPPCSNDQAGGCCTIDCFTATAAPQSAIDLYKAMDSCVYCNVCKTLCATDSYCAVFEPGGDSVCTP